MPAVLGARRPLLRSEKLAKGVSAGCGVNMRS